MQLYAFGGLTDSGEVLFVIFIVIFLIYWANGEANRERYRRWERERTLERERQERDREEWEQSPDGQAYLDQRRREREELARAERERREAVAVEEARRRAAEEEAAARAAWKSYHQSKTLSEISEISEMTGRDFESFLARLLSKMGYPRVELTPINDQGGDIVCESPDGTRTVVQAKRWKGKVGNSAVQELAGAMHYYGCKSGVIITNSTFTLAAMSLAAKIPGVALHNCYWLKQQIEKHLPPNIPEFNWEDYNKNVKGTQFVRLPASLSGRLPLKPARSPKSSGRRRSKSRDWRKW